MIPAYWARGAMLCGAMLALAALVPSASAQSIQADTVTTCGQLAYSPAGQSRRVTMDLTGNFCTNSGGAAQGSTTSGQSGSLIQGAVTTASPTYTTGQTNPFSMDVHGSQRVVQMDSSGNAVDTSSTTITGTVGINAVVPGVGATSLGKAEDSAAADGDTGVVALCMRQATYAATSGADGDYEPSRCQPFVQGTVASASADSGNPVKTGGKYNTTSLALSNGNRGDTQIDGNGATIVSYDAARVNYWSYATASAAATITNTTTAVTIHASCGAGLKNYLTGLALSADALGTATPLAIRDGAGGTVLWDAKLQTAGLVTPLVATIRTPIPGTAATLMEVVTTTASTGGVYVSAQGFCAP